MADLSDNQFLFSKYVPNCFSPKREVSNKLDYENRISKLCIYDWTVLNYSLIKPIPAAVSSPEFFTGLNDDAMVKIILSPSYANNLKIEILLQKVKFAEVTETEKTLFNRAVLNLEFLNSSGKILNYYIGLPYEVKYVNKLRSYSWKKEENIGRFIENDSLTIRAKFSLSYPLMEASKTSHAKSIKSLAKDMKKLIGNNIFPDITVKVGGQCFLAHKAILLPQLNNIKLTPESSEEHGIVSVPLPTNTGDSSKISLETINIPNVNADVFLAVLHYLYCGQMCTSDAATEYSLYEFAKTYQLPELCRSLKPDEMQSRTVIKPFKGGFYWYVKNYSVRSGEKFNLSQSPGYKFRVGSQNITLSVSLYFFDPQNIFLSLHRTEGVDKQVQAAFMLAVCTTDGTPHEVRHFKHLFMHDTFNSYPGFLDPESRFSIDPNLLYDDTLTIRCDVTLSDGQVTSDCNHVYPGDVTNFKFKSCFKNLRNLFETENFSDVTLIVEEKEYKAHKFVLSARSSVFARMFESDMAEKLSGCVKIEDISSTTMKCVLAYIYTGTLSNLTMNHAAEVYRTADKYELLDLRERCTEFIMENLDADTACEVMILADLCNDTKMKEVAKTLICRKSSQALLTSCGLEMMNNYPHLAQDILDNLSAVYCSLPPQDVHEQDETTNQKLANNVMMNLYKPPN